MSEPKVIQSTGAPVVLESITKVFEQKGSRVEALEDLSLAVEDREFVVVVGPSGCGKSTLLKIVAGLLEPSSGAVSRHPTVERGGGIGMVFQTPVLMPWRSVMKNVLLPTEILGIPQARGRATQLLEQVGLSGFEDAYPYQLSGGMQQRVAICRALISDPPVLLMDEPFGALDAITRERMNHQLQDLWLTTHKTVVLVTHSIEEAIFLSDRILVMTPRPGRIATTICNELDRPRGVETYKSPLFAEYGAEIREIIGSEPE